MQRFYSSTIERFLADYNKMVFVSGPRQVGKTTITKDLLSDKNTYFNWDYQEDRNKIISHYDVILNDLAAQKSTNKPRIALDEIHKFHDWKNLIKGFYDKFGDRIEFLVTGSAKLNVYKKGGDSLMGRYINLTINPLSVAEIASSHTDALINPLKNIHQEEFDNLIKFGGFAEPYFKNSEKFHIIWSNQRFEQLFREDVRNIEDINNINGLELLAILLKAQICSTTNYSNLANKVRISEQTTRRWCALLEKYYYCFSIKPWSQNVTRSLIKSPKYYLWDWSQLTDEGQRFENFIASHLLKAVTYWNETGLGKFALHYLRDKEKREADFIVIKNDQPWFIVEAKSSDSIISQNLRYFHELIKPEFSFQVIRSASAIEGSCFDKPGLWSVPASSFLSQLV